MKSSENFNFKLPENTDASSLDYYNDNFKSIDKNLKAALNPATTIVIDTISIENSQTDKIIINCNGMRYCGRNYTFQRIIFEKGFLNSNATYYIKAVNVQNPNTETLGTLTANLSVVEYTGNINAINDEFILATFTTDMNTMYTLHSLRYYPNSYVDDWLEQHRMYTYPQIKKIDVTNTSDTTKLGVTEYINVDVSFYQDGFLISADKKISSYSRTIDLNTGTTTENVFIHPNKKYAIQAISIVHDEFSAIGFCDIKLIELDDTTELEEQLATVDGIIAIINTSDNGVEPYKYGLYELNSLVAYPNGNLPDENVKKSDVDKKQDKLTTSNIGTGLGIDGNGKPYVPIDTALSSTSENPVQNKAVFDALDKKYEVIETVTTTEEISLFVRSAEPNGTAYKFDRLKVLIELPAASAKSSLVVKIQKDAQHRWVFYYYNAEGITTSKRKYSFECYKSFGYYETTIMSTTGANDYALPAKYGQVPAFWGVDESQAENIGYLRIEGNLPIGTEITILGVRA